MEMKLENGEEKVKCSVKSNGYIYFSFSVETVTITGKTLAMS